MWFWIVGKATVLGARTKFKLQHRYLFILLCSRVNDSTQDLGAQNQAGNADRDLAKDVERIASSGRFDFPI